ncbi:MAG: hypothetical protein HQ463_09265 [Bacteroidetes bacterium]|nr:hypothetical protein [Bacteroidota bacterium]
MRKVLLFVYLIHGKVEISFLKSLFLRYNNFPTISHKEIVIKNIKDFFRILCYPILFFIRFKKVLPTDLLFYEMSNAAYIDNRRKLFLNKYTNFDIESIKAINNMKFAVSSYLLLIKKIPLLIKIWLIAVFVSFITIFSKGKIPFSLFSIFNLYCLNKYNKNSFFVFCLFSAEIYVTSYLISSFKSIEISTSNSMVYPYNRYSYLPNAHLKLCSKYQEDEIKIFVKNNWLVCKTIERWGLEEVDIYTDEYLKNNNSNTYKIGFYSSGEWARIDGLDREFNIDNIKNHLHLNNPAALFAQNILNFTIQFCAERQLSLAVYLHPFERDLLNTHGIEPPFLSQVKQLPNVYCSTAPNTISNVYEAEIGVSPFSTTIWDRFNFDKIGFIGEVKGYEYLIDRKYLGAYNQYIFNTRNDLEEKLNAVV